MKNNKPNIVFIVLDALRAKNLSCYGYKRKTSPNIDSLAKKGILFRDAFSSNNATEKSFLSILSSRHILLEGSKDLLLTKKELNSFSSSGGVFLQEILKKRGYKTYCLKELYNWQKQGFDYFYSLKRNVNEKNFLQKLKNNQKVRDFFRIIVHHLPKILEKKIKAIYGRSNGLRATNDAIKIIKKSKKKKEKFFIWVDYNDTHIPYNPKEFTGKFKEKEKSEKFFKKISDEKNNPEVVEFWKGAFQKNSTIGEIIARYDNAISYDDFLIGKLIKILKEENLLENTLIFLFSDHGESFYEHGIYFDHHGLYDCSTNFPFIISGQGIPKNRDIKGFVQHEDILPTLLKILKINKNQDLFDGEDLLPLIKKNKKLRTSIFMEEGDKVKKRAIRTEKYKYIEALSKEAAFCRYCNKIHGGVLELYNLEKDPLEKQNLAKVEKEMLIHMKTLLERKLKELKRLNEKRRIKNIVFKR